MARKTRKQQKLDGLRVACKTILELAEEPDADPVDLLHRLISVCLLMDPQLRRPQTRAQAIEALSELTLLRLQGAAEACNQLSPDEKRSLKDV